MLTMNLQLFAHKKGTGSSHNGRDSESKRLGAKRADGQFVKAGNILGGLQQTQSGRQGLLVAGQKLIWCVRWSGFETRPGQHPAHAPIERTTRPCRPVIGVQQEPGYAAQ